MHTIQKNVDPANEKGTEGIESTEKEHFSFTVMSKHQGILTKRMKLKSGKAEKDSSDCWMSDGKAATVTLTPKAFGPWLRTLKNNQALVHGVSIHKKARIVSGKKLKTKPGEDPQTGRDGLPVISRTKIFYAYPTGPGLLMLDHDKARKNAISSDARAFKHTPRQSLQISSKAFFRVLQKRSWSLPASPHPVLMIPKPTKS